MEGPLQPAPRLADRLEAVDKEIRAWGRITRSQAVGQILSLNLEGRAAAALEKAKGDPLFETVNYHSKRKGGELERVSLRFAAHGIFLERGVGKGRPVGSPAAELAAKPWLAPILPAAVEALADRLAEGYADVIAAEASLSVAGIIDTKISK
jgi:hypothetical protein